ncbi:hypothetical protein C5B90_14800 [Haloferax sp. Atlit-12N]|uniref:HEAT repeat domain-containing protein n=1 Tax=Haloferax sp. Atlit-12N TaxID=2077203 RepID=UPI000E275AEF|nr:HEAT repeat domain-containing protein [Haloferax sp. Atlit-12N]RDZ62448.1 hypothetical protein C5B90_14800 [Haloferax sp. Atlit-12N]
MVAPTTPQTDESLDAVIVGAGAAGVGIGVVLEALALDSYAILERDDVGASFRQWPEEMQFITPSFPSNSFGCRDLNAVTTDTSPAFALDRLDRAAHEAVIEAALDDEHHAARRNALVSLFKLRGEGACDALVAAADDPSERVREWAAHLLGGVETDRAAEALSRLADDEQSVVRETAVRAQEVDSGSFRRQFTGVLDETDRTLPGEDDLNRTPNL